MKDAGRGLHTANDETGYLKAKGKKYLVKHL